LSYLRRLGRLLFANLLKVHQTNTATGKYAKVKSWIMIWRVVLSEVLSQPLKIKMDGAINRMNMIAPARRASISRIDLPVVLRTNQSPTVPDTKRKASMMNKAGQFT
jgi:hypothetical protein